MMFFPRGDFFISFLFQASYSILWIDRRKSAISISFSLSPFNKWSAVTKSIEDLPLAMNLPFRTPNISLRFSFNICSYSFHFENFKDSKKNDFEQVDFFKHIYNTNFTYIPFIFLPFLNRDRFSCFTIEVNEQIISFNKCAEIYFAIRKWFLYRNIEYEIKLSSRRKRKKKKKRKKMMKMKKNTIFVPL